MVSIRFVAGLLLSFLLAFQTLISALADHQGRRVKVSWVRENTGNIASVEKAKVVADGISASVVGKRGLGGRKLMAAVIMQEKGLKTTEETMKREGSESITNSSKKTERDKNASEESLERPQNLLNNQDNEKGLKTRTILESQSLQNLSLESWGSTSNSNDDEIRQIRLLEEADEKVMQLMRKDYGGMKKPLRKPPVNNNEPND